MKTTFLTNPRAVLAIAASFAVCGAIRGQSTTTVTTTPGTTTTQVPATTTTEVTSDGTISSFAPQTFVIKSETAPAPVTYSYSATTQYVDEAGNVVTREMIKPGVPVTVHYVRQGDQMVASRVIVHKTVTSTTTTEPGRPLTKKEAKEQRDAVAHPEREARRAAERGKPFPPVNPSEPKTTTETTTTTSEGTIGSFTPEQFVIKSTTSEGPSTYRYSKTTQYVDEAGAPVSIEVVKSGVPVTVSYIREGDAYTAQRVIVHTRTLSKP